MVIGIDRACERARADCTAAGRPLKQRPTVIRSAPTEIDFLPCALAHIGDEKLAGAAVKAVAERIAQTEREDFVGTGR
jgi:hypothetical protein